MEQYLKASNMGVDDGFGTSVALYGNTLVVGAPGEDGDGDSLPDSGAVYVFRRTDGRWHQQAYLKASNAGVSRLFGTSVALNSSDRLGITLAVGAPEDDPDHNGAGYVFRVDSENLHSIASSISGGWKQQIYVAGPPDSFLPTNGSFGFSVALHGDTLVIGAPYEEGYYGGGIYVYRAK